MMSNAAKHFDILITWNACNYFDSLTKLFSKLLTS